MVSDGKLKGSPVQLNVSTNDLDFCSKRDLLNDPEPREVRVRE
jgi:hypothetical protein